MSIHPLIRFAAGFAALCAPIAAAAEPSPAQLEHQQASVSTSEGLTLAAYISRPRGASGPLPSLFLTQSVACGSIAPRKDRLARQERVALAANYALIRVERAGTGASEGEGCDALDYETEVRHYREAFDQLRSHPWVDQSNIVVIGSSLGSTVAPLVAQDKPVTGVVVQGAGALTYFERMMLFDRLQLERQADFMPDAIDREMRRRLAFHYRYLIEQKTPAEIAAEHPDLQGVWESLVGTDASPHYGRPYAWHWQAAEQNWLAAWAGLEVPIMVVFGEYEQFESRHGHRAIVDLVNRLRPGTATWLEIPQAGHGLRVYDNPLDAYARNNGVRQPELFVEPVAAWLKRLGAATDPSP
ncbi:MAG: alpha/beta hydrolase [Pseudomonadota bacterium]